MVLTLYYIETIELFIPVTAFEHSIAVDLNIVWKVSKVVIGELLFLIVL